MTIIDILEIIDWHLWHIDTLTLWHFLAIFHFKSRTVELVRGSESSAATAQAWILLNSFVHFVSNVSNGKSAKGIGWVKLDTDLRQKQTHPLDGIWATFGERECSGGNPYRGVSIPFKQSETSGKLRKGLQWEGTQERIKCDRNTKKWTSPAPHFAPRAKVLLVLLSHRRKSNA